jgi:uncharacterized protein with von Willebrand factor type A (vWA) domain
MKDGLLSELNIERVLLFCRALRAHGLAVTPSEVVAAAAALPLIDTTDREEVFLGLRSLLTTRVDDFPVFEELFEAFWNQAARKLIEPEAQPRADSDARPRSPKNPNRGTTFLFETWASIHYGHTEPLKITAASDTARDTRKDFGTFNNAELTEIADLARRIVKRLARNPNRRWKAVRSGPRVNLRRSLRQSLKTGGELIELSYKKRKQKRTKLIVICDVSGSMDIYSRLLLQFVYGLQNSFAKVETFVFSTSLSRITGHLRNKTYQRALERLSSKVHDWSGGTRIGASLAAFNADWIRRIDRRTIVLILSDGWDVGEPEQLVEELSQLKKRAGRLIWLNPLLGSPGYQPLTRGMQAALPFINVFAPANNLASLRALEAHLTL